MKVDQRSEGAGKPEVFYSHISQLTSEALAGNPKKQKKALNNLVKDVKESQYFDPAFVVLEKGLDIVMKETNPTELKAKLEKLSLVLRTIADDTQDKGGKDARINPTIRKILASAVAQDQEIFQSPRHRYLREHISGTPAIDAAYRTVMDTAKSCEQKARQGSNNVYVTYSDSVEKFGLKKGEHKKSESHAQWWNELKTSFNTYKVDPGSSRLKDDAISVLKEEPQQDGSETAPFVDRKFSGITFEDLEKMKYPLNGEDTLKWVDYLTEAFSSQNAAGDWLRNNKSALTMMFLISSTLKYDSVELSQLQNSPFLLRSGDFQGKLLRLVLYEKDPKILEKVKKFLEVMPNSSENFLITNLTRFTMYPETVGLKIGEIDAEQPGNEYAFSTDAINWKNETVGEEGSLFYTDEIGMEYLNQVLLPHLRQRMHEFGVGSKFESAISRAEQEFSQRPFELIHLQMIKEVFHESCGEEFLKKLGSKAEEIREVKQKAWELLEEEGLHYLPMMNGLNVVNFSENSVSDIMGLESIGFKITGELDDWKTNVLFKMKESSRTILGTLDANGKLILKAEVEKEIPGLYLMLNHIAVLAFRDLTVQVKKSGVRKSESVTSKEGILENAHESEETKKSEESHDRARSNSLPRYQSDKHLISEVSKGGSFIPRPIEMHPAWVKGGKEYFSALELYNEAIKSGTSQDALQWITSELESARANSYRASEEKVGRWPNRYESNRVHVVDPITSQERDLVTWVIQHISPKPTEEEAESQVKMYVRYYSHSSSLASLEQMKPWFVGLQ